MKNETVNACLNRLFSEYLSETPSDCCDQNTVTDALFRIARALEQISKDGIEVREVVAGNSMKAGQRAA